MENVWGGFFHPTKIAVVLLSAFVPLLWDTVMTVELFLKRCILLGFCKIQSKVRCIALQSTHVFSHASQRASNLWSEKPSAKLYSFSAAPCQTWFFYMLLTVSFCTSMKRKNTLCSGLLLAQRLNFPSTHSRRRKSLLALRLFHHWLVMDTTKNVRTPPHSQAPIRSCLRRPCLRFAMFVIRNTKLSLVCTSIYLRIPTSVSNVVPIWFVARVCFSRRNGCVQERHSRWCAEVYRGRVGPLPRLQGLQIHEAWVFNVLLRWKRPNRGDFRYLLTDKPNRMDMTHVSKIERVKDSFRGTLQQRRSVIFFSVSDAPFHGFLEFLRSVLPEHLNVTKVRDHLHNEHEDMSKPHEVVIFWARKFTHATTVVRVGACISINMYCQNG